MTVGIRPRTINPGSRIDCYPAWMNFFSIDLMG